MNESPVNWLFESAFDVPDPLDVEEFVAGLRANGSVDCADNAFSAPREDIFVLLNHNFLGDYAQPSRIASRDRRIVTSRQDTKFMTLVGHNLPAAGERNVTTLLIPRMAASAIANRTGKDGNLRDLKLLFAKRVF